MKFVSITSDELKEAILESNRISIQKQSYDEVRYAVDNPSDVEEYFKYNDDSEKMFFGYVTKGKKNKYVFLLMQHLYSEDIEKCVYNLIGLITALTTENKQKVQKIKDLEAELENIVTEQTLDEIDELTEELSEDIKPTVNTQVKLPSQKSYITIDNFDMFT